MDTIEIGVIGGSGVYDLGRLQDVEEIRLDTPFGSPSDAYVVGSLEGRRAAFLARHGRGHRINPSGLPFRANIHGFKQLGVRRILSASAVGSLREGVAPLDLVIPDQFYDRTRMRQSTFFDGALVVHVAFADPLCGRVAEVMEASARSISATVHRGGTYVCMEGPHFSTRAESLTYRNTIHGATVIGMTNLQEAKLAREAEICYATLALVTDYDCWHEEEDAVTTEAVIEILHKNAETAREVIARSVAAMDFESRCSCEDALAGAILTPPGGIEPAAKERVALLVGRHLDPVD